MKFSPSNKATALTALHYCITIGFYCSLIENHWLVAIPLLIADEVVRQLLKDAVE